MKQRYHCGSASDAVCLEAARIRALINELERRLRILDGDIAREEDLAGVSNPSNADYPVLARMMTAQRDNLKQTIAALEHRFPPELAQSV